MREVLIGQTDYSVLVMITGADGAPETGLAHTDIDIAYARVETDNDVTTSDVAPADLASLTAAHSDWGWEEVSSTDHPGLYRLDIADAVFASGAWEAVVTITDASGTDFYPVNIGFRLVNIDPQATFVPAKDHTGANLATATALDTVDNFLDTEIADIQSRLPAALVSGSMSAVLADGVTHGGTTALLRLGSSSSTPAFYVTNSGGHAAQIESSGSGNDALRLVSATDEALELVGGLNLQGGLGVSSSVSIGGSIEFSSGLFSDITGNITGNLSGSVGSVAGSVGSVSGSVGSVAANGITASSLAADAGTEIGTAVWASGTRTLTAIDEDSTTLDLDATIRAAVGMASASYDTDISGINSKLDTIDNLVDTEIGAIQTTLANLFTTALTESYNADGAAPTVAQALMGIYQTLTEGAISGTTWQVKKLDGSANALAITLDSATTPTSKTRSA